MYIQKRNYDRYHKARPLPELADDTPVWIKTKNSQQSGRIVSASSEPRSYVVSTPTGQTRRNRSHVVPIPTQANSPESKQETPADESQRSPVQTRSQTGTIRRPPDRLTY